MPVDVVLFYADLSIFVIIIFMKYILNNLIKERFLTRLTLLFILHLQIFFYLQRRVRNK